MASAALFCSSRRAQAPDLEARGSATFARDGSFVLGVPAISWLGLRSNRFGSRGRNQP
jgi:hypothetical protein